MILVKNANVCRLFKPTNIPVTDYEGIFDLFRSSPTNTDAIIRHRALSLPDVYILKFQCMPGWENKIVDDFFAERNMAFSDFATLNESRKHGSKSKGAPRTTTFAKYCSRQKIELVHRINEVVLNGHDLQLKNNRHKNTLKDK